MDVYHKDLSKNLQRLRLDDKYTDVTITPFGNRDKTFRCHRIILAAMSTYFETMFDAGLSETMTGEVELPCDEELCETVLSFIYTGNDVSTKENVADLLEVANMMQIESLKLTCLNFLQSNLTQENCVSVMQTAHLQESKELFEQARSLVLKCFEFVAETEDFGLLDPQHLISVLKADNLNCSNERIICEAALSWIEADYENRIDYIGEILDALALVPVSADTIEAKVQLNHAQFETCQLYNEKIKSLKEQGMCLAIMPMQDEAMIVIGGSEGGANNDVMAFSFRQKKWFKLPELPLDPGYNFALCANGMDMYASGGSNNKRVMFKYDGRSNSWQRCPDLPCSRQYHNMIAANNAVFVIGGCQTTNDPPIGEVDMFSLLTNSFTFEKHIDLPTPVRSASVAIQGDAVYILGGIDGSKKQVELAQVMNIKGLFTYRVFYKLPEEVRLQSRAVTLGNLIYLIGKNGEVFRFSEKEKVKQVGKIHKDYSPRKGFGVCAFENKILIVGGELKLQARKDMLQYNVDDNLTVLMQETLPLSRRDFCYAKLTVEQKYLNVEC